MSKHFTIVTLCYERRVFLKRYIEFSETHGISTILVDGSDDAFIEPIPSNIHYYHLPKIGPWQRLKFAIEKVTTDYVVIQADDDFLIPSSLVEAAEFLEGNPDYGSVQGQIYWFNELYKNSQLDYHTYKVFDVENDLACEDMCERVINHLTNYIFTFYSMKKTMIWKRFLDIFYENLKDNTVFNTRYPAIFELTQSIHTIISGKNKMLDSPWLLREKLPNAAEFNEAKKDIRFAGTEIFSKYCDDLSVLSDHCFEHMNQGYQKLFLDGFKAYESSLIELVREGFTKKIGDIEPIFAYKKNEFTTIKKLIDKYRANVILVMNNNCSILPNYCYDSNWVKNIARRFQLLTNNLTNYVIYGAGEHTTALFEAVGNVGNLVGIVDSSKQNWGKEVHGVQCKPPSEILSLSKNVIISSQVYEDEIVKSLNAMFEDEINIFRLYS